jgi:aminopeptidase N
MNKLLVPALAALLLITGCHPKKDVVEEPAPSDPLTNPVFDTQIDETGAIEEEPTERPVYHAARTRDTDVRHMKLEVSFDWQKQRLNGKAVLEIAPYFYTSSTAVLDAKNFEIHKVALVNKGITDLKYDYDGMKLTAHLDRPYKRGESYNLLIEYTARPNEFESTGGSDAISGDKGLYFINPDSAVAGKPTQIWTQGETEANSRWFPTVDAPNEKITQDIAITVDKKYKTLSNGLMVSSKNNANGTRTDTWKQDKPHAPYLVMMAIGDFAVVKDTWTRSNGQKMDVHYYVEKQYEEHAKAIFGDTPEMLTFFSKLLGVEYPWDKYHQVIVRDYVSGAMENTSAVIHGEFFNQTSRELVDENNFSTIAHELFHHWFGDLVTCESWSNLPVNESFANYSQYLWDEYKYGREEADMNAEGEMMGYIYSAQQSGFVDLIRYDYGDKEEMFDANSYNKGGRVLHMLRKYLGDEAFFEGLRVYLTDNQYGAAEIDHLRLAFEKVCGEDLHWFFNQWFLNKGHAVLEYQQAYDEAAGTLVITIIQKQDLKEVPIYRLPIEIDVYVNGKAARHRVFAEQIESRFEFATAKPELVIIDAEHCMLAEVSEEKPHEQYVRQYHLGKMYADRKEAVEKCSRKSDEASVGVVIAALNDPFYAIRAQAIRSLRKALRTDRKDEIRMKLMDMAKNDARSSVREAALSTLYKEFGATDELNALYEGALKDKSYLVMSGALEILADINPDKAVSLATPFETERSATLRSTIASIYAQHAGVDKHAFFLSNLSGMGGFEKIGFVKSYMRFVKRLDYTEIDKSIPVLQDIAVSGGSMWMKYFAGYQELQGLVQFFIDEAARARDAGDSAKAAEADKRAESIRSLIKSLLEKESDAQVLQFMGGGN